MFVAKHLGEEQEFITTPTPKNRHSYKRNGHRRAAIKDTRQDESFCQRILF